MNGRERFHEAMHFGTPDAIPLWDLEGFTEEAIRVWCQQGFPTGMRVYDYFSFDGTYKDCRVPLDAGPIPSFVPRMLQADDEWTTTIDRYGFTVRTSKKQGVGPRIYYYVAPAVRTRQDWQQYKRRYDPHDIRRYPLYWGEELLAHYRHASQPIGLAMVWGPGRGIKHGYTLGHKAFLHALYDDPALIHDIFDFWADFTIELIRPVVEGTTIDYLILNEDGLAYKNHSLVSPATYRTFWSPYVRKVVDFVRGAGVDVVGFYTSGDFSALIPVLLETGFNLFAPLECAAGMEALQVREAFGRDVLLMGNIARAALMADKASIDAEFHSKVPRLIEQGGYIPVLDDMVLPDIPFENYRHYIRLIREFVM